MQALKPFPASQPECYLSLGFNVNPIGQSYNGATYTSLGFNDYMLNNGAQVSLGTGTNLRLGKHVLFTYLRIRGIVQSSSVASAGALNSVRIMVGMNPKDSTLGNLTTAANVAQWVESTEILEAPQNTYGGGSIAPLATMVSPSTDYTIMYDRVHLVNTPSIAVGSYQSTNNKQQEFVDIVIPLGLERTYNSAGTVDQGSFFAYFVGGDTIASNTAVFVGEIRVDFVNCWSFEDLGTKAFNFLRSAARLIAIAKRNPVVNAAIDYIPSLLVGAV
jgi:hypothetical protein